MKLPHLLDNGRDGHVDAEIDHVKAGDTHRAGDDVLAGVVDVALDGAQYHDAQLV